LLKKIFTPGPTQVHPEVLKATVSSFTYHRSTEFKEFHAQLISKLKQVFLTKYNLNLLTTSGTGSMEAAVVNFCQPGERVLFLNQGRFGSRWGSISKAVGLDTDEISVCAGEAVNVQKLESISIEQYQTIFLTHSETSTATMTDIKTLSAYIKENSDAFVIVDGISSIGAIEFKMDEWDIDVAVSASQKGLMTQPGIAVISYNERAYEKMMKNEMPRYYFDLRKELNAQKMFLTSWTPAIGIMYGVDKACDILLEEGMEAKWKKVQNIAEYFRNECKIFGFNIFSKQPSNSLTAITFPDDIPTGKLVTTLKQKYGVQIANGQDELKDKIARISHMGDLELEDIVELTEIIKKEYNLLR
jgi:aspartate aminotransferase-like enzyme